MEPERAPAPSQLPPPHECGALARELVLRPLPAPGPVATLDRGGAEAPAVGRLAVFEPARAKLEAVTKQQVSLALADTRGRAVA